MKNIKNFIGAIVCAIICAMSLATPVLAGQGGGLVGGGGDGLIDTTNFVPLTDVVVPLPPTDNIGYLTVEGDLAEVPGYSKINIVRLYRYQVDSKGSPVPFSMESRPSQVVKLNVRTAVRPGRYMITGFNFIEIKKNEDLKFTFKVSKISIPDSPNEVITAEVFRDYTNREMQERELLLTFLLSENKTFYQERCNKKLKVKPFCTALKVKSPEELENLVVRFTSSGDVERLDGPYYYGKVFSWKANSGYGECGYYALTSGGHICSGPRPQGSSVTDGRSILVYPGVYKIEWTYSLDGSREYIYGVVVE